MNKHIDSFAIRSALMRASIIYGKPINSIATLLYLILDEAGETLSTPEIYDRFTYITNLAIETQSARSLIQSTLRKLAERSFINRISNDLWKSNPNVNIRELEKLN